MRATKLLCLLAVFGALTGAPMPLLSNPGHIVLASWYGAKFKGQPMANRKLFDPRNPSIAAHRTLPLGTRLLVTNPRTGHSIVVTVQDRGPYINGRSLDLSEAGAEELGYKKEGVAELEVQAF